MKLNSVVYTKAAERIEFNSDTNIDWIDTLYACNCIERVSKKLPSKSIYMDSFQEYFRPRNISFQEPWFGWPTETENQLARQLALLFMAEIAKETK